MRRVMKHDLLLIFSCVITLSMFIIHSAYGFYFQYPVDKDPLPLKPTKNIQFTTDEVTWMSLDVSPDGEKIIFEILGDLYTLPITGGKAERISSGMAYDSQPTFSPDGLHVIFVSDREGSDNVYMLDFGETITDSSPISHESILHPVTQGRDMSYASPVQDPSTDYVIVSQTDRFTWIDVRHTLWLYHFDTGKGMQLIADGEPIYGLGPVFSSDGRYVYASNDRSDDENRFGHQIEQYDLKTNTLTRITNQPGGGIRPVVSSDNKWLVYGSRLDGQTGYRLLNLETNEDTWLAYPVQRDRQEAVWMGTSSDLMPGYSFTHDNSAIITSFEGKMYRVEIPSGAISEIPFEADINIAIAPRIHSEKQLHEGPVQVRQFRYPALSPDGSRVTFSAVHRLYVKDLPDGDLRQIAEMDEHQFNPSWSPDGRQIAFVTWSDADGGHLYTVNVNGQNVKQISQEKSFFTNPIWTPDGTEIVVSYRRLNENSGLHLVRFPAGGGDAEYIAPLEGRLAHFADQPDRIYMYAGGDGLISIALDGSDRRVHLKAFGRRRSLGPGGPRPASDIFMGPNGEYALVRADYNIYRVQLPLVGGENTPIISVTEPDNAILQKLNTLGTHFINWGPEGNEAIWSLGTTLFRYNFEDAQGNDQYEAKQTRIDISLPQEQGIGTIVLRGAHILTMDPGAANDGVIENGAVVIEDNRIANVGRNSSIQTPSGAHEMDVSGMTILPGFIDLHAHPRLNGGITMTEGIQSTMPWPYLANLSLGVTTMREAQAGNTGDLTYLDALATGDITGPRLLTTGPGIFNDTNVQSLDDARKVIQRYAEYYRNNTVKQYLAGDRTQRQLLSIASREYGIIPTTEGADMRLQLTQIFDGYSLEHVLPHFPVYKDVIELTAQSGIFYTPTIVVDISPRSEQYWWTRTDVHGMPKLQRFFPHDVLDRTTLQKPWYHEDDFQFKHYGKQVKVIADAGGNIGVGSHGEMQGLSFHWEIWNIQSGGMSELDALRSATYVGADAIGLARDLGSISEGKIADLIVLEKDPLEDIQNTTSVRYVMKNGLLYNADTLDMLWPVEKKLPELYWHDDLPEGLQR